MPTVYVTVCYPDEHLVATYLQVNDINNHNDILERVFAEWNAGSGQESEAFKNSHVRSLSVNDVVIIHGSDSNTIYQCASVGWNQISETEFLELEKAVSCHPSRFTEGAWYALGEVMHKRRKLQQTSLKLT